MKLSSPLFFVLSTVVSTVLIAAEPCLPKTNDNTNGGFAKYDQPACDACADSGKNKAVAAHVCCVAIYRHSEGRDDDDYLGDDEPTCTDIDELCTVGWGQCLPGLICAQVRPGKHLCQLSANDPNAHAAASLVTSFFTGTNTNGGYSFVLVVVGLLGAAMTTLYNSRHRGLLRRHQYSEVDATRMDV